MSKYLLMLIIVVLSIVAIQKQTVAQEVINNLQDTVKVLSTKDKQIAEKEYNQGVIMLESNKFDEAVGFFNSAINVKVKFPEAFYNRASAKFSNEDYIGAIQDFNSAIILNPTAKYYLARAIARYKYNELQGALSDLDKTISMDTSNLRNDAYYYYGCVLFVENNYFEAITYFSKTIENDDKYIYAYHDRGSCNRMIGKYQLALQDYRKAIQLDSNMSISFNNIASVKKLMQDYDGAIEDYSSAISVDTLNAIAYNNRGTVYKELNKYEEAISDFASAIRLNPDYAIAYSNRANLKLSQKKYKEALLDYDKAIELNNKYGVAYLNRGICKEILRDEDGACKDWSKADALGVLAAGDYLDAQCK